MSPPSKHEEESLIVGTIRTYELIVILEEDIMHDFFKWLFRFAQLILHNSKTDKRVFEALVKQYNNIIKMQLQTLLVTKYGNIPRMR